ncbi:hypothetical protein [Vibrio furnissii]|uniref:hypothetical protein n=1 Tax=Vibrio furnissii TaxID=29494 RepID=UPI001EEB5E2E|nr:hypothetical protein [Vibrio furnissii]
MESSIFSPAANWQSPTVLQVQLMMEKVADRFGCEVFELYSYFRADARTFRRWKENADVAPSNPSSIRYTAWFLFVAIAENRIILTEDGKPLSSNNKDAWSIITNKFVYTADTFETPPMKVVELFLGANEFSISGMNRTNLAKFIGYVPSHFGRLISKMNFSVWSVLLILYGVPVTNIFPVKK